MTDGGGVGYRIARVVCAARDDMRLLLGLPPRPWIGRSVTGRGHGIRPGRSGMELISRNFGRMDAAATVGRRNEKGREPERERAL